MTNLHSGGQRTIALVESATQLLNVAEWAHATGEAGALKVCVLAPKDRRTRVQLETVGALAASSGVEIETVDVRGHVTGSLSGAVRLTRELGRTGRLVIGDPFSKLIQMLLPLSHAEHIVVVDDGTATWEFADCLDAGRPLVRWRLADRAPSHRAARATRLLSPSIERKLTVFSCLAGATPAGASTVPNRYAFTRSWCTPQVRAGEIDVVGASLVETGVIDRGAYLQALRSLTARFTPVRYLAHRRESDNRLAEIAALPGVRVVRPPLPVELELRQGPVAQHVITFPSTAAHSLPVVLGDLPVRLQVRRVDPSWFTPDATEHAREFVARIAADAPLRPLLESA